MIKLVATDIDGTILIPEEEFTDSVKACVKKLCDCGIKVVLVTGRMKAAAKLIADELKLQTPIVSYQGGLVTEGNSILYERYLTTNQTERILDWAKQEKIHINLYNDDILYSESDCYEVQRYCARQHTEYKVSDFSSINKDKVNKILAIDYNNSDRIDKLEETLPAMFPDLYIVKSTPNFLEFSNKEFFYYIYSKNYNRFLIISKSNHQI